MENRRFPPTPGGLLSPSKHRNPITATLAAEANLFAPRKRHFTDTLIFLFHTAALPQNPIYHFPKLPLRFII